MKKTAFLKQGSAHYSVDFEWKKGKGNHIDLVITIPFFQDPCDQKLTENRLFKSIKEK